MSRSVIATWLVILAMGPVIHAQESIPADVLQKVKSASVFIKVTLGPLESSGSGFVVNTDGDSVLIVTNAHVVAKPDFQGDQLPPGLRFRDRQDLQRIKAAIENLEPKIEAVFRSGTREEQVVAVEVVGLDKKNDLAVLKGTKVRAVPVPIPLDVDFRPAETTPVFTFGFPFGEAISNSKGNPAITVGRAAISSVRLDERGEETVVQIDGALNPGNSGGPVVDVQGRLVGVAVATIRGSGIGFAVPPKLLQRLLSGSVSRVVVVTKTEEKELALEIQIDLLDPFQKIRKAAVCCSLNEKSTPLPQASAVLEGTRLEVRIENGKGLATWRFPKPSDAKMVLFVQPILIDAQDQERRTPVIRHPLAAAIGNSSQAAIPNRRGPFSLMRPMLDEVRRDSILGRLNQSDAATIMLALQELSHFDPDPDSDKIGPALEKLLSNPESGIRASAAKQLSIWGEKLSAPSVLKLLEDSNGEVRHAAIETLATWEHEPAVAPIADRLRSSEDRQSAKRALVRMAAKAEAKVIESLGSSELAVRLVACEILGEIGSKERSIPPLKELAQRENGLVAVRAREAIDQITGRGSQPRSSFINLDGGGNQKIHVGLPIKQGEMLLTEGALIFNERGPGFAVGFIQTGPETMECTYINLIRFPKGNPSQTTFSTLRKKLKDRVCITNNLHCGDESLAFEHTFQQDQLPFMDEQFLIQEQRFDPRNGRLFLIDLSGAAPVTVQKNIDLPSPGAFASITNGLVLEFADRALNDLIQKDEGVRDFVSGKKLVQAGSRDQKK